MPRQEAELLAVRALLESEGIPFYVHNEHFGAVYPGIQVPGFNARRVMVPPSHAERARELLEGVLGARDQAAPAREPLPWSDRLRMLAEALLGWLVPAPRPRRSHRERPPLRLVRGAAGETDRDRRHGTG